MKIVNTIREYVTEYNFDGLVMGLALVIIIGLMISSVVGIMNIDVGDSIIDGHLEALDVLEDELLTMVAEYNDDYYNGYFDGLVTLEWNG